MNAAFFISSGVAIVSTILVIAHPNAVHALLYLIISLLSVALIFFVMGAPFVAALEIIIYAGAIIVLFLFVVMMLNMGEAATAREREWLRPRVWIGPSILALILLGVVSSLLWRGPPTPVEAVEVGPHEVGAALFGPYMIAVQLAALLMLAGLIGASHLRRRELLPEPPEEPES